MDQIYEMGMACEAILRSTPKSREKYKVFIDKQKAKLKDKVDKYNGWLKKCEALSKEMESKGITTDKEIKEYLKKNIQPLANEFMRLNLPTDPMMILKSYKGAIKSIRYRADRKHPEMEEALAALNREVNEGGELYNIIKEIADKMSGKVASSGTTRAAQNAATAQAMMTQQVLQQQMQNQINQQIQAEIQMQMQMEIQNQIQQQINQQIVQQMQMQAHMGAMGMM